MYDGINSSILQDEIDGFLKKIAAYRSRLVINTCKADYSFQLGVFGFQHFISDFTKSLEPQAGLDMVDVLNVNNHILMDRAHHTLPIRTPEGKAQLAKISDLCDVKYDHVPQTGRIKYDEAVNAARGALERYLDASVVMFTAEMQAKGFSAGLDDMEHIFSPVRSMLAPIPVISQRQQLALKR